MATFIRRNREAQRRVMAIQYFQARVRRSQQVGDTDGTSAADTASQRQLRAFDELGVLVQRAFNSEQTVIEPKKVAKLVSQLAAQRPGPRSPVKEQVVRLAREAQISGRSQTYGQIASQVFPQYDAADGNRRRHFREVVRLIVSKGTLPT
jgi:hypothetical protein